MEGLAGDGIGVMKKIDSPFFPPRVVSSRFTTTRSKQRCVDVKLTNFSATTLDGRRYLRRTEQVAPVPIRRFFERVGMVTMGLGSLVCVGCLCGRQGKKGVSTTMYI